MIYYHITDEWRSEHILHEGLLGNPVVYLTSSFENAIAIRRSQELLQEVFGTAIVFRVKYDGEVFIDPHVQPLGTAWMIYDDLPPTCLCKCYANEVCER